MGITTYIPLMKPGAWLRNIIIVGFLVAIPYLIPVILGYAIATNYNGLADGLGRAGVPGMKGGGVGPAIAVVIACLVLVSALMVLIPALGTMGDVAMGGGGGDDGSSASAGGAEGSDSADDTDQSDQAQDSESDQDQNQSDSAQDDAGDATDDGASYDQPQGEPASEESSGSEGSEESGAGSGDDYWGDGYGSHGVTHKDLGDSLQDGEIEVVETDETDDDVTTVAYRTHHTDTDAVVEELLFVSGTYAAYADDTGKSTDGKLVGEIRDSTGEPMGTFEVDAGDARAYVQGDLSEEEFSQRVVDSVETNEEYSGS